jgi:hypothetical protein
MGQVAEAIKLRCCGSMGPGLRRDGEKRYLRRDGEKRYLRRDGEKK